MDERNDILKKLKAIRMQKGFSQSGLAEKMGISQNTISQWENGERAPSVSMLKKLTVILECSADTLLEDID